MGEDKKTDQQEKFDLSGYKWKNRITIVYADTSQNADYVEFENKWSNRIEDVNDRDLILIELFGQGQATVDAEPLGEDNADDLIEAYKMGENSFQVILIGKDGGVKLDKTETEPQEIFDLIDTMPMRQQEMKER